MTKINIDKITKKIKLDYLVIKLNENLSKKIGIVSNSRKIHLDHGFSLEFDLDMSSFKTINLVDLSGNKLGQIMIVNENNKRTDFYDKFTIYGTFFNLYKDYLTYILDYFNLNNYSTKITRFDLCSDLDNIGVMDFTFNPKRKKDLSIHGDFDSYNYIRYTSPKRYKFRIYNKIKDILDKNLYSIKDNNNFSKYQDIIDTKDLYTRVELEINSRLIREKDILLGDVFNQDYIQELFRNYYISNIDTNKKLTRSHYKKEIEKNEILLEEKKRHTGVMLGSYLKKALNLMEATEIYTYFQELEEKDIEKLVKVIKLKKGTNSLEKTY